MKEIDDYIHMLEIDKAKRTIELYGHSIKMFVEYFNIKTIDELNELKPGDVNSYQIFLKGKMNANSVNSYIRPLRCWARWLIDMEYIDKSPLARIKDLKIGKPLPVFLSDEEIEKMVNACNKVEDKLILTLLLTTGMRRNELSTLKIKDIVGDRILINGKGNKQRSLLLQPEIAILLNGYIEDREKSGDTCEFAIVSQKGGQYSGEGIRLRIKALAKKAGLDPARIDKISPHKMRHTFATNLVSSGIDIKIIQEAMGHANIGTTASIYAHVTTSVMDRTMLGQKGLL